MLLMSAPTPPTLPLFFFLARLHLQLFISQLINLQQQELPTHTHTLSLIVYCANTSVFVKIGARLDVSDLFCKILLEFHFTFRFFHLQSKKKAFD